MFTIHCDNCSNIGGIDFPLSTGFDGWIESDGGLRFNVNTRVLHCDACGYKTGERFTDGEIEERRKANSTWWADNPGEWLDENKQWIATVDFLKSEIVKFKYVVDEKNALAIRFNQMSSEYSALQNGQEDLVRSVWRTAVGAPSDAEVKAFLAGHICEDCDSIMLPIFVGADTHECQNESCESHGES